MTIERQWEDTGKIDAAKEKLKWLIRALHWILEPEEDSTEQEEETQEEQVCYDYLTARTHKNYL